VSISHLISSYGYWAVFALVGLQSLGIPLPGETALIVAGAYAGHTHRLSPWITFAVASAGAIIGYWIGDKGGYWIGDKGGYCLARKYGHKVRLDERKLKIARYLFGTHGPKVVFFGRFVSVLRTYAAFLAGTSKMQWRKFLPADAAGGGILWVGIYTLAATPRVDPPLQVHDFAFPRPRSPVTGVLAVRRHPQTCPNTPEENSRPGPTGIGQAPWRGRSDPGDCCCGRIAGARTHDGVAAWLRGAKVLAPRQHEVRRAHACGGSGRQVRSSKSRLPGWLT